MKNNSVSAKDLQHPSSKYDYDGITGTWLLIPAKFHILILALLLPIIIWVLPSVPFKGEFQYIFADYRYYIAGAMAIFCISSAILSIIKAKQVRQRLRPMSRINNQVVARNSAPSSNTDAKNSSTKNRKIADKNPKIHIGQVAPKNAPQKVSKSGVIDASPTVKLVQSDTPKSSKTVETRVQKETTPKTRTKPRAKKSADKVEEKPKKTATSKVKETTKTDPPKKANSTKKTATTSKSTKNRTAATTKSQKNSKQMQLDL